MCSKKFSENRMLQVHINKHNGIKRHQCEICEQRFCYKPSLIKHKKKHSQADKEDLV